MAQFPIPDKPLSYKHEKFAMNTYLKNKPLRGGAIQTHEQLSLFLEFQQTLTLTNELKRILPQLPGINFVHFVRESYAIT